MQKCPTCGTKVHKVDGVLRPVDPLLDCGRGTFTIPYACPTCNAIHLRYRAIRDVVYLFPTPKPTTFKDGQVILPDYDYGIKHNTQEEFRDSSAIILSMGKGAFTPKGKWLSTAELKVGESVGYHKRVPWRIEHVGSDGLTHEIVVCGYQDIFYKYQNVVETENVMDEVGATL